MLPNTLLKCNIVKRMQKKTRKSRTLRSLRAAYTVALVSFQPCPTTQLLADSHRSCAETCQLPRAITLAIPRLRQQPLPLERLLLSRRRVRAAPVCAMQTELTLLQNTCACGSGRGSGSGTRQKRRARADCSLQLHRLHAGHSPRATWLVVAAALDAEPAGVAPVAARGTA